MFKARSTLGAFLRSFQWGHVRQLDRVSRELLARAWAVGARPGDGPLTIDLDSTICETYGLAKEGAHHHGHSHPPKAPPRENKGSILATAGPGLIRPPHDPLSPDYRNAAAPVAQPRRGAKTRERVDA